MTPDCSHYFCSEHGDFLCADCHQRSNQQQIEAIQQSETRDKVIGGVVGVLITVVVVAVKIVFEIIKAVFENI
jgi:hypothetical protein